MARPRKYTPKTLAKAVNAYFDSITRTIPVTERKDTGRRDEKGHIIYEDVPVTNKLGRKMMVEEFVIPPTVGSMCEVLGIHRSTWAEYCDKDKHPEFSDTTTRAGGRIRTYLEQQLLTRKDVKGIIFDLQNNHGYSEKRHLELDQGTRKAISAVSMPISEKKALLEEIAKEFLPIGEGDETAEE